jgi:EmrB/QacA subfamily drug resistance transporter
MPGPADRSRPDGPGRAPFPADAPGTEEVPVVHWPALWRDRLTHRVHRSDRYARWVLGAALTGMFAVGFTITVLAVSIGDIADDLGSSDAALTWVVSGPLLAVALTMPLFGKLGDVRGHRRLYLAGFATFAAFTALCALAWDAPSLIVLRLLAAAGGAATGPASMALVMQAYPVEDRVKAMGWWSLVGAGAPVIGVVAGAPLIDAFGWRWIFLAQAPISVVALLLAVLVLRETPRRPHEPVDVAGAALLAVGTVSALLALDRGAANGWTQPLVLVLLAVAPVAFVAFVRAERRAAHPLLPPVFFARRNFTAPLVAQFGSNFAYMGGFIVTPFLMRDVFDYSLRATGYVMLCRPLTFSLFAPLAGYLTVRVGERRAGVAGTLAVVASMAIFAIAADQQLVALVVVGLVLSGLGLGASSPALVSSVANTVPEGDLGVANAAQQTVTQIGVVAGIQIMSAIQASGDGTGPFVVAYVVGGALAAVGVVGATFVRSTARPRSLRVVEAA